MTGSRASFKHSPVIHVLGLGLPVFLLWLASRFATTPSLNGGPVVAWLGAGFCLVFAQAVLALYFLSGVNRYEVLEKGLRVRRLWGTTFHPWSEVTSVVEHLMLRNVIVRGRDGIIAYTSSDYFPRFNQFLLTLMRESGRIVVTTGAWLRHGELWYVKPSWEKFAAQEPGTARYSYLWSHDLGPAMAEASYEDLNEGRKRVVRLTWWMIETQQAGIVHYFWNSAGNEAAAWHDDLREYGADEVAEVMEHATCKIFGVLEPSAHKSERRAAMREHFNDSPIDNLDPNRLKLVPGEDDYSTETNAVRAQQDHVMELAMQWVERHPEYFTHLSGGPETGAAATPPAPDSEEVKS